MPDCQPKDCLRALPTVKHQYDFLEVTANCFILRELLPKRQAISVSKRYSQL